MSRWIVIHCMFLILMGLTGCHDFAIWKPVPMGMERDPPEDAPQEYKDGWNDGCETGLSTMVTSFYKTFYTYRQDPNRLNQPMYYKAWKDAYTYCRQYSFRSIWAPIDEMKGAHPFNMRLCAFCYNQIK